MDNDTVIIAGLTVTIFGFLLGFGLAIIVA